jgi:TonB-dependent receptor
MKSSPSLKDHPELLIREAWNNFDAAQLDTAYFRFEKNLDRQRTASLDIEREFVFSDWISARLKAGGRYGARNRFREASSVGGAYWLSRWSKTERLPDGTLRQKGLQGTRFASMLDQIDAVVSMRHFLDFPPTNRDVYERYALYPLINRDAIRLWYDLNKNGASGTTNEYQHNVDDDGDYYDIAERIAAGYLMTTVSVGQWMTVIGGARVESEDNDYRARFSRGFVERFPNSGGGILDTTTHHNETVWLPNFQSTLRLTDFMNLRVAAYRALARPDFNSRLDKFIALKGNTSTMTVGNPDLLAAKAWNFEVNTSFFGNYIGLISLSAFYKDIKDMYHLYNGVQTKGTELTDSLGIQWRNPFVDTSFVYNFTYPFNSQRPTKVWGIEFEHQANLTFLPGALQNIVLNYNFSLVRSETYQILNDARWDTLIIPSEFGDVKVPYAVVNVYEARTKLENQPEFFANVALGYDFGGFSARVSLFHQGEFTSTFTAKGKGDRVVKSYSRVDLSARQKITGNISLLLNLNNLTNTEEPISNLYTGPGWDLPVSSQKYGLSGDFGVRIEW